MRGGKRAGAGRKPSESTVRISVPEGVLPQVLALIEAYKNDPLNEDQVFNRALPLNSRQKIKNIAQESIQQTAELSRSEEPQKTHQSLILNNSQLIKDDVLGKEQASRNAADRKQAVKPNKMPVLTNTEEIKDAIRGLERVDTATRKVLKKSFGSLFKAAKLGIRADGKGIYVPDAVEHLLKVPADRVR
ncbi:MAG: hypothetical protein ABL925_16880 [Methylococcales bacterium]